MKIKGIALGTTQEQLNGGDQDVIAPEALHNIPTEVPLTVNFKERIGTAKVYLEDGRLVVEADVSEDYLKLNKLAIGYVFHPDGSEPPILKDIAVTEENKDKRIPPYDIIEQ